MNTVNANAVKNAKGPEKKEAPQIKLPPPLQEEIMKTPPSRPPWFGTEPTRETSKGRPCGFGSDGGSYRPPGGY